MDLFASLFLVAVKFNLSYVLLWKVPILLADIGIGLLLAKYFMPKSRLAAVFAVLIWFLNPYFALHDDYTYLEPLPILAMFFALIYLEKDEVASGAFYALSIIFKTFPVMLFPLFILKSKKKLRFLLAGVIVGVAFLIPFMKSLPDLLAMLNGSLLVHAGRVVQGRPILFYISYFYHIELFRMISLKFYAVMSMFFGWIVILLSHFLLKIKDKYILSTLAFLNFYIFTPVLNRTYFIWFLPIFIIACYKVSQKLHFKPLFYILVAVFWIFYYWYLAQWKDGFDVWHP
jgi:hypothetical protein